MIAKVLRWFLLAFSDRFTIHLNSNWHKPSTILETCNDQNLLITKIMREDKSGNYSDYQVIALSKWSRKILEENPTVKDIIKKLITWLTRHL